MIRNGEKTEEYRDISMFYSARLFINGDWIYLKQSIKDKDKILNIVKSDTKRLHMNIRFHPYDCVCFHLLYTNLTMKYEFNGISIEKGDPNCGAPADKDVFVIKLGNRLEN